MIANVYAQCNSGQININSASKEELDNLDGIGPAKAEAIILSRPFNSIDDLVKVSGIKNATLNKIKAQGLACVINEEKIYTIASNENARVSTNQDNQFNQSNQNIITGNEVKNTNAEEDKTAYIDTKDASNTQNIEPKNLNNKNNYTETTKNIINLNPQQENKEIYSSKNEIIKIYAIYFFACFLVLIIAVIFIKNKNGR